MKIIPLTIPEVKFVELDYFEDERGYFLESYNQKTFAQHGISTPFVQSNQSFSLYEATIRGLHFQIPPYAQAKLVRVVNGGIIDVAVDIRINSPTYGKYVARKLEKPNEALYVPIGFAHGFITTKPNTIVQYQVSNFYSAESERGIRWNDGDLNIDWWLDFSPKLSEKDAQLPWFHKLQPYF